MKTIKLETKDERLLLELMTRGLVHTQAFYRDWKRMDRIQTKVLEQLQAQSRKER